jgi:hypothetical protein
MPTLLVPQKICEFGWWVRVESGGVVRVTGAARRDAGLIGGYSEPPPVGG